MAKVELKKPIVEEISANIKDAQSVVIVDHRGLTVAEDTALRVELRQNGVQYGVVKNTLTRFAMKNVGLDELETVLNGTTSMATSDGDPIAPMRIVNKYAKQLGDKKFTIKGGFMDGKAVDMDTINRLASIPALPVLQAQVLGTMLAPISALAYILQQVVENNGAPVAAAEPAAE